MIVILMVIIKIKTIIIIAFRCDKIFDYINCSYHTNKNKKIHIYTYVNMYFLLNSGEHSFYISIFKAKLFLSREMYIYYVDIYIK